MDELEVDVVYYILKRNCTQILHETQQIMLVNENYTNALCCELSETLLQATRGLNPQTALETAFQRYQNRNPQHTAPPPPPAKRSWNATIFS